VNLVCPSLPQERRQTREDWLAMAQLLDEIGGACRAQGMQLSYHNHSFEFVQFDETFALDLLLQNTSPENVLSELDTYWVQHGGADPVAYLQRYAGRISILHLKDMADDADRSFAEVGRGILDWSAVHDAALAAGVEWYCVEQDTCPGDSLDSARVSARFVAELLG
jgi:sugar phosphate isomerase/epimerase